MAIQVLKPKYHVEECLNEIRECLEIGWTGMGFKTDGKNIQGMQTHIF